jgi:hypothetical protein
VDIEFVKILIEGIRTLLHHDWLLSGKSFHWVLNIENKNLIADHSFLSFAVVIALPGIVTGGALGIDHHLFLNSFEFKMMEHQRDNSSKK